MDKNILILSSGRRVELVKAFQSAIAALNEKGRVIAVDCSKYAPSLYFADGQYIVPPIFSENYLKTLIEICLKEEISLVVPTIDTELQLLAANRESFERESGAKLLICDAQCIDICCDKLRSAEFFERNGFAIPKTLREVELERNDFKYPLFIKPRDGSSSINAFKIENRKQLDFFLSYVPNPIVQEYVTGKEYTIDAFSDFAGNIISVVPRQRLATRSGEVLKGKIEKNRIIIEDVKRLLNVLKPIGHITIQGFLGTDNIFRYIEINPRFGGGSPMSFRAGAKSCEFLIRLLRGETLSYTEKYLDNVVFSRFDDCVMIEN